MNSQKIIASVLALTTVLSFSATVVFANEINISASTTVNNRGEVRAEMKANAEANKIPQIIKRADQEITRRIEALTKFSVKINELKKVSDSVKATISANIQSQIASLTTLKAKIDADTDITVLRTDVKSITNSYRIFALVMPQAAIIAASDRALTIADTMTTLSAKLQARITAAQSAGKDVAAIQAKLTELNTKVANARVQAAGAASSVAALTPDQGDTAKAEANRAVLFKARASVKTANQDLRAAQANAKDIAKVLKSFNLSATSTASVQENN